MSRKWLTTLGVAAAAAVTTLAFVAVSAASTSHRNAVPTAAPNAITQIGSVGVTYKIGKFVKRGKRLVAVGQVVAQFTPTAANPARPEAGDRYAVVHRDGDDASTVHGRQAGSARC